MRSECDRRPLARPLSYAADVQHLVGPNVREPELLQFGPDVIGSRLFFARRRGDLGQPDPFVNDRRFVQGGESLLDLRLLDLAFGEPAGLRMQRQGGQRQKDLGDDFHCTGIVTVTRIPATVRALKSSVVPQFGPIRGILFRGARLRWAARAEYEPTATEGGDPSGTYKRWFGRASGRAGWHRGCPLVGTSCWPGGHRGMRAGLSSRARPGPTDGRSDAVAVRMTLVCT